MFGKLAGEWFGTNSISFVLKQLNSDLKPFDFLTMCVFNDGVIKKRSIVEAMSDLLQQVTLGEESKEE